MTARRMKSKTRIVSSEPGSLRAWSARAGAGLQLLPGGVETITRWTPFATMLQFPGQVLLGTWSGPALLLAQLAWAAGLHVVGLAVFTRATRKLVIDGG